MNHLGFNDKIGILDNLGIKTNPLTNQPYSDSYRDLAKVWSTYPAYGKAETVLTGIANNQLIIITSSTGSGKTTLIPKFALHYTNYQGKIAITLPKRIVTLSAATFAAKTLDVVLGKEIGYVYKGSEKNMLSPANKMVYMTDGHLVMEFVRDPLLTEYNVIVIDEIHEKTIRIDLLLLFIKNLLLSNKRPDLKVILMSATIDPNKYQKYFSGIKNTVINIAGQTLFGITVHFLPKPSNSYMVDGFALIKDLLDLGVKSDLLFFITTSNEALQLCRKIRPEYPKVFCIEVYSDMSKELKIYAESRDQYLELGNYNQKLLMATNVAESSLTIDGLKYVIDSGYELYNYFDPLYFGEVLEKRLISKAQMLQRRGRVGRTEDGIVYHLITKDQFDALEDFPIPDILKSDITMDLLKIIQITESKKYQDGVTMLEQMMDTPKKPYINIAKQIYELYHLIDSDGKLTKIGHEINHFSALPINRTLFLIYAFETHCAREASIIIAMIEALDSKLSNLFFKSDTICESNCEKASATDFLKKIAQRKGDHFTFLKIYQTFKDSADQKTWARKYGIRLDQLNKASRLADTYYYKMVHLSRIAQLSRVTEIDVNKRLTQALKLSHQHLTAKKLIPVFSQKKVEGSVNKDSVANRFYTRKELAKKTFIYDEMININGNWEFSTITLI